MTTAQMLDPIRAADRHEAAIAAAARQCREHEENVAEAKKVLRAEMLMALRRGVEATVACPGSFSGQRRPVVDVVFGDANDALQNTLLTVLRLGAEGADVQLLCRSVQQMVANSHADIYADAMVLGACNAGARPAVHAGEVL